MHREHPLNILRYSARNIWLLVFPLLRSLKSISLDTYTLYNWFRGAWFDLLVLAVILLIGYLRWRAACYSWDSRAIYYTSGIFVRSHMEIPLQNISALTAERAFWLRPFRAVRVYVNTRAGTFKRADLKLLMRRSDYREIRAEVVPLARESAETTQYRPHWWNVLLFSFLFSSSFSGALYLSVFFFQSGRLLDEILSQGLTHRLAEAANEVGVEVSARLAAYTKLATTVPPVAISIAAFLLAAWLVSFVANMLRYHDFRYELDARMLRIRSGIFTKRHYSIPIQRLNYIDLRQNLMMKLFCVMSVHISCAGYGNKKNELPVLMPVMTRRQMQQTTEQVFPGRLTRRNQIHPALNGFVKYLWFPAIVAVSLPLLATSVQYILPTGVALIRFGLLMLELPTIWMLAVKVAAWLTTGVTAEPDMLCIRYCRWYSFHTILADRRKLVKLQVQISPFQRLNGKCDVRFYFHSEMPRSHAVLGMKREQAEQLVQELLAAGVPVTIMERGKRK